jgi:hypothetical protein
MLIAGHWCEHLINVRSSMLCDLSITSVVDAWWTLHFIYHLWKWTDWQFPQGLVRHRGLVAWMVHSLDLHWVNVLFRDISRVSCMPQRWNFLMISAGCTTYHVRDMRDIGTDAGILYASCRELCNSRWRSFQEVCFNPVNTKLTQNISMCFASSVNQMGQTLQWHILATKRFLANYQRLNRFSK